MERALTIAKIAALSSITMAGLFLCYGALRGSWALDKIANASSGTLAGLNTTISSFQSPIAKLDTAMDTINAPCTDNGHQYVCGTLANVNQTTKNVGILAAQGAEQVKQSRVLIQATTRNLDAAGSAVVTLATTANTSVAELSHSASRTMDAAKTTISAAQPVLASANVFMGHADLFMGSLSPTVQNVDRMTGDWASMSDDAKTKFHLILFPPPCKTFGCRAARVYPYVKGIAELGEASYWTKQLVAP